MTGPFGRAIQLLASGDREVYFITLTSLRFSLSSSLIAGALGIPCGVALGLNRFPGRKAVRVVVDSMMSLPTVLIGLVVYALLSRSGPLGGLGLLFRPGAVVVGQAILALPIVVSLVSSGVGSLDPLLPEVLTTLGATRRSILWMTLREARAVVLTAVLAAFGRVVGEVGIAMMLGGNIRWYTRTITTAIALQTSKGEFELGIALGIILLAAALLVNALLHAAVKRG